LAQTQQVASRGVPDLPAEIASERIDLAAIQAPDGRILSGVTHLDATDAAVRAGVTAEILARCGEGFITTSGRYVNRIEAQRIAISANQLADPGAVDNVDLVHHDLLPLDEQPGGKL
jgi:hypothetical protein